MRKSYGRQIVYLFVYLSVTALNATYLICKLAMLHFSSLSFYSKHDAWTCLDPAIGRACIHSLRVYITVMRTAISIVPIIILDTLEITSESQTLLSVCLYLPILDALDITGEFQTFVETYYQPGHNVPSCIRCLYQNS